MARPVAGTVAMTAVLAGLLLASVEANVSLQSRQMLNDGHSIPMLGLGTYRAPPGEAYTAVLTALAMGYRHIDTATRYENEEDVGAAIRDSGIPREDLFVTTKLWFDDHGFDEAIAACKASLERLGLEYVDLYLIHAPHPGKRLDSWRALEHLQSIGLVRSIGVSNYGIAHLEELLEVATVTPAVNQIEMHPFLVRHDLVVWCEERGIVVEGYSPLAKARRLDDPDIVALAAKYDKTPAQIMIRWSLQHGFVTIPKSTNAGRMRENADVYDFNLSHDDMAVLNIKDEGMTTGWNPVSDPAFE